MPRPDRSTVVLGTGAVAGEVCVSAGIAHFSPAIALILFGLQLLAFCLFVDHKPTRSGVAE